MSLRFEKLMAEHRLNSADADKTEVELLQMLVERYNSYKSTSAIRKWQITDDMRKSIEGIIIGMTSRTRQLIRAHLDYNKWEESGHWPAQYIGPFSLVLKGCLYCFCVFSVRIQRVAFESEAASAPWVTTRADTLLDTNLDRNFALHWVETFYFVFLNAKHQELYGCIYEYIFLQYIYMNLFGTSTSRSQRLRRSFTSPSTTSGGLWTRGKSREHAGQGWGGTRKLGQDMLTNAAWQFGWFMKAQSNLGLQPKFAQKHGLQKTPLR